MESLATLLLAHLIADFPLQMNWLFRLKKRHWTGVLLHSGIHGLVAAILLRDVHAHWPLLATLTMVHFAIDSLKLRFDIKYQSLGFLLDQLAHVVSLIALASWPSDIRCVLAHRYLYPAIAYALLPTLLMFLSVLAIDLKSPTSLLAIRYVNNTPHFIRLSQLVGYSLVVGIIVLRLGGWT